MNGVQFRIETGARLHFGPLACNATAGLVFGGVGLMVDSPRTVLTAAPVDHATAMRATGDLESQVRQGGLGALATAEQLSAVTALTQRIDATLRRIREAARCSSMPDVQRLADVKLQINVLEALPEHQGLGSGTQSSLAAAQAAACVAGIDLSIADLARLTGRGCRSAIGVHGFRLGGFLIDDGKATNDSLGELALRAALPEAWRFLLICPAQGAGLSGRAEAMAFEQLPPMSAALSAELRWIAFKELAPSVQSGDHRRFAIGLGEFGDRVGDYFAPVQGDRFADRRMAEIARRLRSAGWPGAAQSSWGPTLCLPCSSSSAAIQAANLVAGWDDTLALQIAGPLNRGCSIQPRQTDQTGCFDQLTPPQ